MDRGEGRPLTQRLPRKAALAKEIAFTQDSKRCFFSTFRYNAELHLSVLDGEGRLRFFVRQIAVHEWSILNSLILGPEVRFFHSWG